MVTDRERGRRGVGDWGIRGAASTRLTYGGFQEWVLQGTVAFVKAPDSPSQVMKRWKCVGWSGFLEGVRSKREARLNLGLVSLGKRRSREGRPFSKAGQSRMH